MRFHFGRGKGFHAILPFQITGPPPCDAKSAMCEPGTFAPRPIATQSLRLELLSQDDGITGDSPMITAVYETHLSMEQMLTAFAELRGDDAEEAIG
jgi:hypothetical protein